MRAERNSSISQPSHSDTVVDGPSNSARVAASEPVPPVAQHQRGERGGRGGRIGGGGTGGGGGEGGGGGGERLTSIGRRFCFSAETGGALNK